MLDKTILVVDDTSINVDILIGLLELLLMKALSKWQILLNR